MLISKTDDQYSICLDKGTRLLLFGGKPLEQEHYLLWNFVSSDKEKLKTAQKRWVNKEFPKSQMMKHISNFHLITCKSNK